MIPQYIILKLSSITKYLAEYIKTEYKTTGGIEIMRKSYELPLPKMGPKLTADEIKSILKEDNIPLETWGTGKWHSFEEFVSYMRKDRFAFRQNDNGLHMPLTVDIDVVVVRVYHKNEELYEIKKVHRADPNRILVRHAQFDGVGETLHRHEQPDIRAAERCLREELGWNDPRLYTMLDRIGGQLMGPRPHDKFNGLQGRWSRHLFECYASEELYTGEDEYVRPDGEWNVHFGWRPRFKKK